MTDNSQIIAHHNDTFRGHPSLAMNFGIEGKIIFTNPLMQYAEKDIEQIFELVRRYYDFTESNDPYGEHDFGNFTFQNKDFFWKIDYYDVNYEYGSPDPADPNVPRRVLTIMHAEDY